MILIEHINETFSRTDTKDSLVILPTTVQLGSLLLGQQSRESFVPVYSIDNDVTKRRNLGGKRRFVLHGILAIMLDIQNIFLSSTIVTDSADDILLSNHDTVHATMRSLLILQQLRLLQADHFMRQQLKHLQSALRHVAAPRKPKHQRIQPVGQSVLLHPPSQVAYMRFGRVQIVMHVAGGTVQEGGGVSRGQETSSKALEGVDHAGDAGVLSEGDETSFLGLASVVFGVIGNVGGDGFVVKELNVFIEDGLEEGHVFGLAFDDVREEEVGFVGEEIGFVGHSL